MENKAIYEAIGKTLAPVEIDSEEAMELFGITKKDLVAYKLGSKRIMIYPYPAPEEVCREMLKELRRRYKREERAARCMLRSEHGKLCACPEQYSCAACRVDRQRRLPRQVSLEALQEEGLEMQAPHPDPAEAPELRQFLKELEDYHPQYVTILVMKASGYTEQEIGRRLQISRRSVMNSWRRIRDLAAGYFGGLGKGVFS